MRLIFHGGAMEVGRSCIEVKTGSERYILDAGIKFKEGGFDYPHQVINIAGIDGLFLSHAHLDHSGSLPLFEHYNIICPIYCTKMTYELTKIMLKDSYKIARIRNLHPAYNRLDLKKVGKSVRFVEYDKEYRHRDARFIFRNAGHIPGSSMIEMLIEDKVLLYTGDFKLKTTELMKGAHESFAHVHALIMESTYGHKQLLERSHQKKMFLDRIEEMIAGGGSVLIPVFSIGRAQDVLIMLSERKFKAPIYYDGMCNKVARKVVESDDRYINNRKALSNMLKNKVTVISSERRRQRALASQGIFITTSGMLQGGPVLSYLKEMWHDPKNAILLTGFQCKRTNGRLLEDEGYVYIDGWKTYVKCFVEKFEFSGHADQSDLREFIRKVRPKNLILQHGDSEGIDDLKHWADSEIQCKVFTPKVGDEIDL